MQEKRLVLGKTIIEQMVKLFNSFVYELLKKKKIHLYGHPAGLSVHHVCAWHLGKSEESGRSLGTEVTHCCE